VATRRGSVPEVVVEGVTGFACDTRETMVEALGRVDALDPRAIRTHAERRFTPERMVDDYLDAYALAVGDIDQPVALTVDERPRGPTAPRPLRAREARSAG